MSGICAIYSADGAPAPRDELDALLVAGAHRAVDGVDRRIDGSTALGHLAFDSVDHRSGGITASADLTISVVTDARLDRDGELSSVLRARDLVPLDRPVSDAELILGAYRQWGTSAVERLRGDFAFVLWDRPRQRLVAARDRLGSKPLCYAFHNGRWYFASEAQQIASVPGVGRRIERRTIARYLAQVLPTDELTPFAGIARLEPGHRLVLEGQREADKRRYWFAGALRFHRAHPEELLRVLRDAVDRRLRRPRGGVGILLSGGLDSCSVAAMAHETLGPELHAVTHAFDETPDADERRFTEAMRKRFGLSIDYHLADSQPLLPQHPDQHPDPDDPFLGWSAIHAAPLSRLEAKGVRVLLTGHGGDSVFGGSPLVYTDLFRARRFRDLFRDLRRHAARRGVPLTSLIYHYLLAPLVPALAGDRARRILRRPPLAERPPWILSQLARETDLSSDFDRFYRPEAWGRSALEQTRRSIVSTGSVGRAVGLFDRLGHRHRLDIRHPFLDADLVDYVLSLPPEELFAAGESKLPLRRRLTTLPTEIRSRRRKTSFRSFLDGKLRGTERDRVESLLCPSVALPALGFVEPRELEDQARAYLDGSNRFAPGVIFFTACIESWLRSYPPAG